MISVCKEHLEWAIDKFVDEYEAAPDVVDLETVAPAREAPKTCGKCGRPAKYMVVRVVES